MSFLPDFNESMRETDCFVAWITTRDYEEVKSGWSSCEAVALIPIDGTETYWLSDQASNFNDVFGTNTSYIIDPEECLADNFAYAMLYGIKGNQKECYCRMPIRRNLFHQYYRRKSSWKICYK